MKVWEFLWLNHGENRHLDTSGILHPLIVMRMHDELANISVSSSIFL